MAHVNARCTLTLAGVHGAFHPFPEAIIARDLRIVYTAPPPEVLERQRLMLDFFWATSSAPCSVLWCFNYGYHLMCVETPL